MLNQIQLEDKAQELLIEASGEKNSTKAKQLVAFANAMRDFKKLLQIGRSEMYFQHELIKSQNKFNTFLETYNNFKVYNTEDAKKYAIDHDLHHKEFCIKCLSFLLGIKHESVL